MKLSLRKPGSKSSSRRMDTVEVEPVAAPALHHELTTVFKVFDKNNDGRISKAELRDVLRSLGEDFSDDDLDALVVEVDNDGDGNGFIDLQDQVTSYNTGWAGSRDDSVSWSTSSRSSRDGASSEEKYALQAAKAAFEVFKNGFISAEERPQKTSLAECRHKNLPYPSQSPCQAGSWMNTLIAWWALPIMMALAAEPAVATRPFSPTGSAPAQGAATEEHGNGQHNPLTSAIVGGGLGILAVIRSYIGLVLEWVKVLAVCLALLLLARRIWGIIMNTEAWRSLNVLGGENPAAETDEEMLADNDRLLDNRPRADLELTNRHAAFPRSTFTRVSNWTTSSMSIHESHNA